MKKNMPSRTSYFFILHLCCVMLFSGCAQKVGVSGISVTDGIVPYESSHLDGAESEKIVHSGHSTQTKPQTILEVRRILHEHLDSIDKKE